MATMSSSSTSLLRVAAVFIAFSSALFLISYMMVQHTTLKVSDSCNMTASDSMSCNYTCSFTIECQGRINARVIALHFNWDAIYDNRTIFTCNHPNILDIQLPKRNYNYLLRGAFYNEEYGVSQHYVPC